MQWRKLVDKECRNQTGCTSDINAYSAYEDAKIQYKNTKKWYSDSANSSSGKLIFSLLGIFASTSLLPIAYAQFAAGIFFDMIVI